METVNRALEDVTIGARALINQARADIAQEPMCGKKYLPQTDYAPWVRYKNYPCRGNMPPYTCQGGWPGMKNPCGQLCYGNPLDYVSVYGRGCMQSQNANKQFVYGGNPFAKKNSKYLKKCCMRCGNKYISDDYNPAFEMGDPTDYYFPVKKKVKSGYPYKNLCGRCIHRQNMNVYMAPTYY